MHVLEPGKETSITRCNLPEQSAFILGHEEMGISFNKADYPGIRSLSIPQFGTTQSLNVSIAASIVMYEYIRQCSESAIEPC
jgi:tRNA G18 (ribose-2'-O)-methylase SpoU